MIPKIEDGNNFGVGIQVSIIINPVLVKTLCTCVLILNRNRSCILLEVHLDIVYMCTCTEPQGECPSADNRSVCMKAFVCVECMCMVTG